MRVNVSTTSGFKQLPQIITQHQNLSLTELQQHSLHLQEQEQEAQAEKNLPH